MLDNCLNYISRFACAPIQGTTLFLGEIQMKSGSQSELYFLTKSEVFGKESLSLKNLYQ